VAQGKETENPNIDLVGLTLLTIGGGFLIFLVVLFLFPLLVIGWVLTQLVLGTCFDFKETYQLKRWGPWGLLSLVMLYYLFWGSPWAFMDSFWRGIVFTFFDGEVKTLIEGGVGILNKFLPRNFEVTRVTGHGLRVYLWCAWFLILPTTAWMIYFKTIPFPKSPGSFGFFKEGFLKKPFELSDDQIRHHVHVLGASGFGKSVLMNHLVASLVRRKKGFMLVDLKADIETIRHVMGVCKEAHRLKDIQLFSCSDSKISSYYNVLKRGSANQLKDHIMGAFNWSEEYYKNETSSIILKILRSLVYVRDHKDRNIHLGTLLSCLKTPDELVKIKSLLPESEQVLQEELEEVDRYLRDRDLYKNLQGVRSQLEGILLSDFGERLMPQKGFREIDIIEATKKQEIIYFLLDSRRYSDSAKALGRMILGDLKATSSEIDALQQKEDRKNFTVIIDEFSDLASEEFLGFLDRARSSGLGIIMAHQEISDLKKVSPEMAMRLMQLTSTTIAFLTKLSDSAEAISSIAGTKSSLKSTERVDSLFGFNIPTGQKSVREVEEFKIHPNLLKNLNVGEAVVVGKYPKAYSGLVQIFAPEKSNLTYKEFEELMKIHRSHIQGTGENKEGSARNCYEIKNHEKDSVNKQLEW